MKTNYQLIKIQDKFILVSDEEWVKGDWYYTNLGNIYQDNGKFLPEDGEEENSQFTSSVFKRKIIAGIQELPSIDFSLLSEEDCKTIGWVDVENLATDCANLNKSKFNNWYGCHDGFREGFKTAQSLNDKMLENEIFDTQIQVVGDNKTQSIRTFIQSLQQTSWDVEVNKLNQIIKIT